MAGDTNESGKENPVESGRVSCFKKAFRMQPVVETATNIDLLRKPRSKKSVNEAVLKMQKPILNLNQTGSLVAELSPVESCLSKRMEKFGGKFQSLKVGSH